MFCIDTSILVEFLRGNKDVIEKFNGLDSEDIFISPITLCELFQGAYLSKNPELKTQELNSFINSFSLLDFNKTICNEFGKQYAKLSKIGKMIPEFDLMIACFAKVNGLILVSKDEKHFNNLGIKVELW